MQYRVTYGTDKLLWVEYEFEPATFRTAPTLLVAEPSARSHLVIN